MTEELPELAPTAKGGGARLNFERLAPRTPAAERAAELSRTLVAVGDFVRALRHQMGLSQSDLAKRVETTQAHISELERGVGRNGPTVAILTRIVRELGDDLVIGSQKERDKQYATLISSAQSSIGDTAESLSKGREGLSGIVRAFATLRAENQNPAVKAVVGSLLTGIYLAFRLAPSFSEQEIQSACRLIEATASHEDPTYDEGRIGRLVHTYTPRPVSIGSV